MLKLDILYYMQHRSVVQVKLGKVFILDVFFGEGEK